MPAGWTPPGNESTTMISNAPLPEPRPARLVSICLAGIVSLCLLAAQAAAQTGQVAGTVVEDRTGNPLPYTNVAIVGTNLGAITGTDGSFKIIGIPLGRQTIQASYLGYQTERTEAVVTSGVTARVDFRMKETVAKKEKEVVITAERPLVEVEKASTMRSYNQEELKRLTAQPTLDSVIEQQPGVTKDNDEIHIRGGRTDETLYIVDGVKMRDVLTGDSHGSDISARSVAELNIITGGFDAKYGQALSGIVEVQSKEGTDEFHGYVGYQTDRLTGNWQTDLMNLQLSGRLPLFTRLVRMLGKDDPGKATCFLDLSTDLNNGYLPSIRDLPGDKKLHSSYQDHLFGSTVDYSSFFYPRANNNWRLLFKSAWRATEADKFKLVWTKSLSFDQGFGSHDVADINRNTISYPWNWSQRLDHYYTDTNDRNSFSLTWLRSFGRTLNHELNLTRYFSATHEDVAGLSWTGYSDARDTDLPVQMDTPFFIDAGDAPYYRDRYVETWGLSSDWTKKWGKQEIRWGLNSQYENVQFLTLNASSITKDKPLGDEFDLFHVYPNTGALYLQDRIEHEGLIANLGLRYDYWFPGAQAEKFYDRTDLPTATEETRAQFYADTHSLFGHRFKGHLSPRISVSHPITQRDNLFFNYGHFTQRPAYFYVYAKSSSQSSEEFPRIGNPDLNPEVSVQYELGGGHQFSEQMAAKVSIFYKDIYDYPTSTTLVLSERSTSRSNFFIYRNLDYARSRGIELELRKRRTDHASWSAAYTYSVAKGKSSDPNSLKLVQESGGDARETSLDEEYMWWNRPHKFTVWYDYRINKGEKRPALFGWRLPDDASINLYYMIQSGRAYTPQNVFGEDVGQVYSRNGPVEQTLNGTLTKSFRFMGRKWEFQLQGWNLMDDRAPLDFDPVTGKRWEPGQGGLNSPYQDPANLKLSDADLVRKAGVSIGPDQTLAQVAEGIRRSILATVYEYSDPAMRAVPRNFRVGIGVEW